MKYDLIVIGGGPSGMMAAGRAAENGARVLLIEKNKQLGRKLLLTGKGRCNLTNAEFNNRIFVEKFGKKGQFLFSPLSKLGVQDTIMFFNKLGLPTKIERGKRVFPQSDRSIDVLNVLIHYLRKNNVEIRTQANVKKIVCPRNVIEEVVLANGDKLKAKNYAICTGGKSYPIIGSDGKGYDWLKKMHHTIIDPKPALTSIIIKERWIKELEGLSLKNVSISLYQAGKKVDERFGEALFTARGMSGPIILDMSRHIGQLLKKGRVELVIDFKPALSFPVLDKRIMRDFAEFNKKIFKNSLDKLLPQSLIPVIIRLSGIQPKKKVCEINKLERKKLVHLLKTFKLQVVRLNGFQRAIITTGGVDLKEVDSRTMHSKIIQNLYLAGEVLDLDGPTGGFNLQSCWSTGFTIGESFKKNRKHQKPFAR